MTPKINYWSPQKQYQCLAIYHLSIDHIFLYVQMSWITLKITTQTHNLSYFKQTQLFKDKNRAKIMLLKLRIIPAFQ